MAEQTIAKTHESRAITELGTTGLDHTSGYINEEFLPQLSGKRGIKIYREMSDNDPIIGAATSAIRMIVKRATWSVKPDGDNASARDEEVAEFIGSCMNDMSSSWDQFVSQAMDMIQAGFQPFEILYKRRTGNPFDEEMGSRHNDNRIGWRDFASRAPDSVDRWNIDRFGRLQGIVQMAAPEFKEVKIPGWKLLNFRSGHSKNNPEGKSALRNAYRPWFFKKRLEEIEATGVERDLNGIPMAWIPPALLASDATDEERATLNALRTMMANVKKSKNEGILFPLAYDADGNKIYDFELVASRGRRSHDTSRIISRYNKDIAASMLADFILIGHENVGSFALASAKTHIFSVAVSAYLDEIKDVMERRAIPRLMQLNGMDDAMPPRLAYSDIETVDLDHLASYVTSLSRDAGLDLSGEDIQEYLKDQAGMPADGEHNRIEPDESDDETTEEDD